MVFLFKALESEEFLAAYAAAVDETLGGGYKLQEYLRANVFGTIKDISELIDFSKENFTGVKGEYVPLRDTIRGFSRILSGEMDDLPENAFFNVGTIDGAIKKAENL